MNARVAAMESIQLMEWIVSLCVRVYGCDFQTKSVLLRGEICMGHATRLPLPVSLPNVSFHFSNKQGMIFPEMISRS